MGVRGQPGHFFPCSPGSVSQGLPRELPRPWSSGPSCCPPAACGHPPPSPALRSHQPPSPLPGTLWSFPRPGSSGTFQHALRAPCPASSPTRALRGLPRSISASAVGVGGGGCGEAAGCCANLPQLWGGEGHVTQTWPMRSEHSCPSPGNRPERRRWGPGEGLGSGWGVLLPRRWGELKLWTRAPGFRLGPRRISCGVTSSLQTGTAKPRAQATSASGRPERAHLSPHLTARAPSRCFGSVCSEQVHTS